MAKEPVTIPLPVRRPGRAETIARAAEAAAKAKAAEASARTEEARAAAEKAAAEARAAEAKARAIEAETRAREAESVRKAEESAAKERSSYLVPAVTAALAVVAGGAAWKLGRLIGRVAALGAKETIQSVNALGREAAKLQKIKGTLAGTPKGDEAKAIVNEAYALGGVKSAFPSAGYQAAPKAKSLFDTLGKPPKAADYVASALAVEGAVTTGASFVVEDESAKQALRIAGSASLAGAAGLKAALAVAKAAAPRPSSRAIASIEAIRHRIVREADQAAKPLRKPRQPARGKATTLLIGRAPSTGSGAAVSQAAVKTPARQPIAYLNAAARKKASRPKDALSLSANGAQLRTAGQRPTSDGWTEGYVRNGVRVRGYQTPTRG